MKLGDWLKVVGMVCSVVVFVVGWVAATDHNVKTNTTGIERLEVDDKEHEVRLVKLEEKTHSIDAKLGRIETQQVANTKMLERLDLKMDRILEKP